MDQIKCWILAKNSRHRRLNEKAAAAGWLGVPAAGGGGCMREGLSAQACQRVYVDMRVDMRLGMRHRIIG